MFFDSMLALMLFVLVSSWTSLRLHGWEYLTISKMLILCCGRNTIVAMYSSCQMRSAPLFFPHTLTEASLLWYYDCQRNLHIVIRQIRSLLFVQLCKLVLSPIVYCYGSLFNLVMPLLTQLYVKWLVISILSGKIHVPSNCDEYKYLLLCVNTPIYH